MARVTSSSSGGTVSIQDSAGNPLTSVGGALNVNITSAPVTNVNVIESYNEVTNVASGIETTVTSYTNNGATTSYLQRIEGSGTNVSEYRLYKNATVINKKYSSYTEFNVAFEYTVGNSLALGLKVDPGETIYLKAIQNRPSTASFNGNILVLEVT